MSEQAVTRTSSRDHARRPRGERILPWILIVIAAVAVYWSSLDGQFVLDDVATIVENPHLASGQSLAEAIRPPDQDPDAPRWRGPVVGVSLAVNHRFGGFDPRGYHVFNMLVHAMAALILFAILRRTLALPNVPPYLQRAASHVALACVLIWMVHPLLTDSVTYIIQRTTLIMSLCYLLTLYFVIRTADAANPTRWAVAAVITCVLGMLAKEAMVTAPVVVALYDRTYLSDSWRRIWRDRRYLYLGLGGSWFALLWLMHVSPHPGVIGLDLHIGPFDYLLNQAQIIVEYLRLAIWPDDLLLDYGPARHLDIADAALPGIGLLVLLGASLFGYRRYPRVAFLGLWFFAILAPTSSFVPIVGEVGAERRMYLPLIAIVVGVVLAAHAVLVRAVNRKQITQNAARTAGGIATVAVTMLLAATTVARNHLYHDVVAIWRDTCEHAPLNPRAHNGLGVALVHAGNPEAAIPAYQQAIALDQHYVDAHYNLARALSRTGRQNEAANQYELLTAMFPDHFRAHNNLGNIYLQIGRLDDAETAFREVLRIQPTSAFGANGLGLALLRGGHVDSAVTAFDSALQADPSYLQAALNLGISLEALDRSDEAISAYEHVLRYAPQHEVARAKLNELRRSD